MRSPKARLEPCETGEFSVGWVKGSTDPSVKGYRPTEISLKPMADSSLHARYRLNLSRPQRD